MRSPLPRYSNHHSDHLTHRTRAIFSALLLALFCGSPLQAATQETPQEKVSGALEVPATIIGEAPPLQGEVIAYFPGSPKTSGYLSLPEGSIRGGVILIHEWNGLSQLVREIADACAAEGYAALAADLYQGRMGQSHSENLALARETQSDPELIIDNLNAAVTAQKGRSGAEKIATVGWCFGGVALSYALGGETHKGTAIFYGRLVTDPDSLRAITHEVNGTFAGLDRGPSVSDVNAFVGAMRQAGIKNDVHIYDDVNHGFWLHVDRDPDRRLAPAADAWQRLKHYLHRSLQ